MPTISHRQCNACEHRFDVMNLRGHTFAMDHPLLDADGVSEEAKEDTIAAGWLNECPECGCDDLKRMLGCGTGIKLGGAAGVGREYPYYDRNLLMWIQDHQHHERVCKERGIVQCDDGMQVEIDAATRRRQQIAADQAAYDQMVAEMNADPDVMAATEKMTQAMQAGGQDPEAQRRELQRMGASAAARR